MNEQVWGSLMARYRDHLKAEKALADLTIRNYTTDLRPLYDYMKMKGLSRLEEQDHPKGISGVADRAGIRQVQHRQEAQRTADFLGMAGPPGSDR